MKTLYFIGIFITVSACHGQNTSKTNHDALKTKSVPRGIGQPAAELGKDIGVVFQDSQQNYWFGGSKEGVYKYDGKNLIRFTKEDGLCGYSVISIQEDKAGSIYFDTLDGVSKYDGEKITTLKVIDSDDTKHDWKLEPDDLWFRMGWHKSGPYRYDGEHLYYLEFPKTKQEDIFNAQYPNVSFNPYGIFKLYKDRKGMLWFGTASLGVCRFDGTSVSWLYEEHLTTTPSGGAYGIRSIFEDKHGDFWFTNTQHRYAIAARSTEKDGMSYLNFEKKKGVDFNKANGEIDHPYFMSMVEDDVGHLWMADDGVWRYDGQKLHDYSVMDDGEALSAFSIYQDNHGTLWVVTRNRSLYKWNGENFEKFDLEM